MNSSSLLAKSFVIAVILVTGLFLFLPIFSADAALVPCGRLSGEGVPVEETRPCQICDTFELIDRIWKFLLTELVPGIAVILYILAGLLILLGGASPGLVQTGRNIFKTTTWGLIIIFAAWMLTNTIMRSLAGDSLSPDKPWYVIDCVNPSETPPIVQQRYACGSQGCVANSSGQYTDASCGGQCAAAIQKYSCVNNQCTADPGGQYATAGCDGQCQAVPVSITTLTLSDGATNQNYTQPISASGGTVPYVYSISAGSLPPGLSLSGSGLITGTPTAVGDYSFTVQVQDSTSPTAQTANKQLTIKVVAASAAVIISNVAHSGITQNGATITWDTDKAATSQVEYGTTTSFGQTSQLDSNTRANHSVNLVNLQPGVTYYYRVKSTVSGFTAISSTYNFITSGSAAMPLSISTAFLSDGITNQNYSQNLQATGGLIPYSWSVTAGNLPSGLNLSVAGVISGTPAVVGDYSFTVQARDSSAPAKQSSTKQLSIKIMAPAAGVVISNVAHTNISANGATITWDTDKAATSQVEYSTSNSFSPSNSTPIDNTPKTSHSVILSGLTPDTTYYYRVKSTVSGFTAVSTAYSFKTLPSVGTPTPTSTPTPTPSQLVCRDSGVNLCQAGSTSCAADSCSQYAADINSAAARAPIGGLNTAALIKSMIFNESSCRISAVNGSSCGLMQLAPATANTFKSQCGVTANIDCSWLTNPVNAGASICIGAKYLQSLASGSCGSQVRNIAAGYNGGSNACLASQDCAGETSCSGETVRRWECLYDNPEHTVCNAGYDETRTYAPRVLACYNTGWSPGFVATPTPAPVANEDLQRGKAVAQQLLSSANISFSTSADCGDSYHASQNIRDIAAGKFPAVCSSSCSCQAGGPNGNISVHWRILEGLNGLANYMKATYNVTITVTSLATGKHSSNSSHYTGEAADIVVNSNDSTLWQAARQWLKGFSGNPICERKSNSKDEPTCNLSLITHIHWTLRRP